MIFNAYADSQIEYLGITPISCGHIFARKGREIVRPTGRGDWLLFVSVHGEEVFSLAGNSVSLAQGGFILFAPGEAQLHSTVSDRGEFYYMHFFADRDLPAEFGLATARVYPAPPSREVPEIFEKMLSEMQIKQSGYERLSACYLLELLALLSRKCKDAPRERSPHFKEIAQAVQLISREYPLNRSLDDYAAMLRVSKYRFSHLFREVTGISPIAYRNRLRLENAKEMLSDTAKPIEEIAHAVGIESPSYFHRFFKAHTGMSPSEYRRRAGGKLPE